MILNFYVKGKPPGSTSFLNKDPSESYLNAVTHWTEAKLAILSRLDFDDAVEWTKDRATGVSEKSKGLFRYLSGAPVTPSSLPEPLQMEVKEPKKSESTSWSFVGMFSGLRGTRTNSSDSMRTNGDAWTDGEVHADLVRVGPHSSSAHHCKLTWLHRTTMATSNSDTCLLIFRVSGTLSYVRACVLSTLVTQILPAEIPYEFSSSGQRAYERMSRLFGGVHDDLLLLSYACKPHSYYVRPSAYIIELLAAFKYKLKHANICPANLLSE